LVKQSENFLGFKASFIHSIIRILRNKSAITSISWTWSYFNRNRRRT
jgi:hypothetical protein